jgi:hypothetical protein
VNKRKRRSKEMNKFARDMEAEYKKAVKAGLAGNNEAKLRHLDKAFKLRDKFLEEVLGPDRGSLSVAGKK